MFWLLKQTVRFLVKLLILLAVIFGGLTVYFRHVSHIHSDLGTSIQEKVTSLHIHPLTYAQIPLLYRQAVIATEDRRFAYDPGIDPIGIVRSVVVDVGKDGYLQGGSTITQQLVDNTLLSHGNSISYKLSQAFYAIGLYDVFHKDDIFQMYANVIYFGHGAYGLYNAAESYFGLPPSQLNGGELTLLAGLPNAPSVYDPFQNLSFARQRQAMVLENMVDSGVLSNTQRQNILRDPLRLKK
jgi:monofunctional glycosyltransferase